MVPQVEFTTNLPLLQLWIALIVVDAEITMRRAAKILKFRPTLAADSKRQSLVALHLFPREFSGILKKVEFTFHDEIRLKFRFWLVFINNRDSSRTINLTCKRKHLTRLTFDEKVNLLKRPSTGLRHANATRRAAQFKNRPLDHVRAPMFGIYESTIISK